MSKKNQKIKSHPINSSWKSSESKLKEQLGNNILRSVWFRFYLYKFYNFEKNESNPIRLNWMSLDAKLKYQIRNDNLPSVWCHFYSLLMTLKCLKNMYFILLIRVRCHFMQNRIGDFDVASMQQLSIKLEF